MSFYRSLITAVAALGLATSVFAADETKNATQTPAGDTTHQAAMQTADASTTATTDQSATQSTKVDLNKATAKDLMKVKGMTASKAKSIVAYRKKHGDFKAIEDLKEVKGFKKMNEETMKQIQEQLTVG